jgi:hypothetical protein
MRTTKFTLLTPAQNTNTLVVPPAKNRVRLEIYQAYNNGVGYFSPTKMSATGFGWYIGSNNVGLVLTKEDHGDLQTQAWYGFDSGATPAWVVLETFDE